MKAAVVVASNRASAGVYEDTTGPLIVSALRDEGFDVDEDIASGKTLGTHCVPSQNTKVPQLRDVLDI